MQIGKMGMPWNVESGSLGSSPISTTSALRPYVYPFSSLSFSFPNYI